MNGIACKHITHDEIERCLETSEDRFSQDDLTFFEEFYNRLDNCEVCAKRFRVYNFISAMIGDSETEQFKKHLEQEGKSEGIIELPQAAIIIVRWDPLRTIMARTRKAGTESVSEDQAETFDTEEIEVEENGPFYKFTVSEQNRVKVILPQNLDSNQKYELYLWRIADGEKFTRPVEKAPQGGLAVVTDELHTGEYLAAVIRLNQGD